MKLLPLILLTFYGAGCSQINDFNNNSEECFSNSDVQTIVHDSMNREYLLYIPDSYDETSAVPLMLVFHGFSGSASEFINIGSDGGSDMRSLAESDTFILVYPQGGCLNGGSHWNPCPVGGDNKSTSDDLGFVESIISEVSSQYKVNLERIYAAGYSNGGMMAYGLANYKSDLVAAVASVSGVMLECIGSTSHPMPVLHLHGTSDGVLPYNGNGYWSSVQSTLDYWINFNNTIIAPTISNDNSGGMSIDHYVYDQGDSSVSVEHYKFIKGDHVWFSTTYQGQAASELVWGFLSRYDINGLR